MTKETKDFAEKNGYKKSLKLINQGCDYEEVVPKLVSEASSIDDLIEKLESSREYRLTYQLVANHEISENQKGEIINFFMKHNQNFWLCRLIESNLIEDIPLKLSLNWILEKQKKAAILYEIARKIDHRKLDNGDKYRFLSAIQEVNDRHWDRYFKGITWITESEKQFLSMNI